MDMKQKIREARKSSRLSQEELAQVVGVSDKAISAYEVGRSTPPIKVLYKIADATDRPISYFMPGSEEVMSYQEILHDIDGVLNELLRIKDYLARDAIVKSE